MSNIFPKGKIDRISANKSHQISIRGGQLVRKGKILPSMDLWEAADEFIAFLRNIAVKTGSKPVLVCHGSDMTTLFNNLALVNRDCALAESIRGAVDFLQVITDDDSYPHDSSSMSLTKLNPKKLNLSQTILGKDYSIGDEGEAHDALYDAKLLERVLNEYCSAFSQRADIIIDTYMRDGEQIRSSVKYHLSSAKSIKKRLDQTEYFTFFGWDDAAAWAHKEGSRKPDKLERHGIIGPEGSRRTGDRSGRSYSPSGSGFHHSASVRKDDERSQGDQVLTFNQIRDEKRRDQVLTVNQIRDQIRDKKRRELEKEEERRRRDQDRRKREEEERRRTESSWQASTN